MSCTLASIRVSSTVARRHLAATAGRQSRLWLHQSAARLSTTAAPSDTTKQPIHILGAGSIGCLLGAQLSQHGYPVTFLQRSPPPPTSPMLQLTRQGQSLEFPVTVESTQSQPTPTQPIARLIVATKAHQLSAALSSLGPRFDPTHTALVLVQNGYGQHLTPSSPLQSARSPHLSGIGWGSTSNGAYLTPAPTPHWRSVVHAGVGAWHFGPISLADPLAHPAAAPLDLASITPRSTAALLSDLAGALPAATLHATSPEMTQVLLTKLAVNSLINALSATHKVTNGALLSDAYLPRMRALADEAAAVLGATYPDVFVQTGNEVFEAAVRVCEATSTNFSSTYQDVWARGEVPRELEYVHGTLVAWGRRAGVATRTHEDVWERVVRGTRERERARRATERDSGAGWDYGLGPYDENVDTYLLAGWLGVGLGVASVLGLCL